MLKSLHAWFESRTDLSRFLRSWRDRPIPGGARWRYVFGSSLAVLFLVEVVTGGLLMGTYSPSASTAWGSVYYLNHQTAFGWFVRGIHRFATTAMVILALLHLIQSVVYRAYRAPREFLWWSVLALVPLTMALGLTGNMLPWDQRGFWAATVETTIAGGTPVVGPSIQKLVVGGPRLGNLTITRMYLLHVAALPVLFLLALRLQAGQIRKHGEPSVAADGRDDEAYWPNQSFRNAVAGAIVLGAIAFLVYQAKGASLDAPADPMATDYPARPEWYVLWLNRLLSFLPGEAEVIGTVLVPGAIAAVLLSLPLLDRWFPRKAVHVFATGFLFAILGGAGYLIYDGLKADRLNASYQKSRARADHLAERAVWLADHPDLAGIPPTGDMDLLRTDPLSRGSAIFEQKCLGCHAYGDKKPAEDGPLRGWDLKGYASRAWIRDLLKDPSSSRFVGHVPRAAKSKQTTEAPLGGMQAWKEATALESKELDDVADFLALFAKTPADASFEEWSADPKLKEHPGYESFVEDCCQCHVVGTWGEEQKTKKAPALFGYGSPPWVSRMIKKPGAKGFYGYLKAHEQMPGFEEHLTPLDLEMIVRFLRDDYPKSTPALPIPGEGKIP